MSLRAQKIHAAEREFTPVFNEKKTQKRKFLKNGDVFALRERVWLRLVRGEGHGLDRGHAASRRGNRQVRLSVLFFFYRLLFEPILIGRRGRKLGRQNFLARGQILYLSSFSAFPRACTDDYDVFKIPIHA